MIKNIRNKLYWQLKPLIKFKANYNTQTDSFQVTKTENLKKAV